MNAVPGFGTIACTVVRFINTTYIIDILVQSCPVAPVKSKSADSVNLYVSGFRLSSLDTLDYTEKDEALLVDIIIIIIVSSLLLSSTYH